MDIIPYVRARRPDLSETVCRVLKRQYEEEFDTAIRKAQRTVADEEASARRLRDNKKQIAFQDFDAHHAALLVRQKEVLQESRKLHGTIRYYKGLADAAKLGPWEPTVVERSLAKVEATKILFYAQVNKLRTLDTEGKDLEALWDAADKEYQTGCDAIGQVCVGHCW